MGGKVVIGYKNLAGETRCYQTYTGNITACFSNADFHEKKTTLIDEICKSVAENESDLAYFIEYGMVFYDESSNTIHTLQNYTTINSISGVAIELSNSGGMKASDVPDNLLDYYLPHKVFLGCIEKGLVTRALHPSTKYEREEDWTENLVVEINQDLSSEKALLQSIQEMKRKSDNFNLFSFNIENGVTIKKHEVSKKGITEMCVVLRDLKISMDENKILSYINSLNIDESW
jgi:hypothetical protein